ncbi:MAG TPA: hypothetical protein VFE60_27740 [Roseiarcus sp.]|nr:hypothetical protein [Roseiarcus sp.]
MLRWAGEVSSLAPPATGLVSLEVSAKATSNLAITAAWEEPCGLDQQRIALIEQQHGLR